jgi:hypothetical protein
MALPYLYAYMYIHLPRVDKAKNLKCVIFTKGNSEL